MELSGQDFSEDASHHFLGRFATGEIFEDIGFIFFSVFYPSGAAGREDGEFSTILNASDDFGSFFGGGEVSSQGSIIDGIETDAFHGSDHFAHDVGSRFQAEFLAQSDADSRRDLSDDGLCRIVDRGPDFVIVGMAGNGTDGANDGALTTIDAIDLSEGETESGRDLRIVTAGDEIEDADALKFTTCANAVTAKDAFRGIAKERGARSIDRTFFAEVHERIRRDTIAFCELLQAAFSIFGASRAIGVVICEQQLKRGFTHDA